MTETVKRDDILFLRRLKEFQSEWPAKFESSINTAFGGLATYFFVEYAGFGLMEVGTVAFGVVAIHFAAFNIYKTYNEVNGSE